MRSYKIFETFFSYDNANGLPIDLSPEAAGRREIVEFFNNYKNTMYIHNEVKYNGILQDEYSKKNHNKNTITLEKIFHFDNIIHIESSIGSYGRFSKARSSSGEFDSLEDKSAEADRYITLLLPNSSSNRCYIIFETEGNLDSRKRIFDLIEGNSKSHTHNSKNIHISAQQLVDVHYIQEFIQKSSSLKVEFRGKKELRDGALEPKSINLQVSLDFNSDSKNLFYQLLDQWRRRDSNPFQDMRAIAFGNEIFSSSISDTEEIDEVRFLINQKVFTIQELLGQSFSYPISNLQPSREIWFSEIFNRITELNDDSRSEILVPSAANIINQINNIDNG